MDAEPLAEVLADLAAQLPIGHVTAWCGILSAFDHPNNAVEAALINSRPGYSVAAPAHRLIAAWRADPGDLSGSAVALSLRTAAALHRREEANRATLAISGPSSDSVPVRLTSSVVTEIIRSAQHSLLVVSFAAHGIPEVINDLAAAAGRGVHIDLILEDTTEAGGTLRGPTGAAEAFNRLRRQATFWQWPAHHRPSTGSSRAALHAKVIAADRAVALVSSANLTDRALSTNLEIGVVIRDPHLVTRLVTHFTTLMNPASGPLQPVP